MRSLSLLKSFTVAVAVAMLGTAASAQQKILIGGTPNMEPATAMVAVAEAMFAKHGLDAEFKLIPINPTIPPALISNSLQIGLPTPTTFLQAVDSGIDLVIIAGVSVSSQSATGVAIAVRKGSDIKTAKDLVGKRFGVPGINAVLHVMVRRWLREQGVDPKSVNFVEAIFPTHADLLKAGQIDAVVSVDPFLARVLGTGVGDQLLNLAAVFPEGRPTMMYVTTREWATKNADKIAAFRAGIEDAAKFIAANPAKAREDIGKTLSLPPPAFATLALPSVDTKVTSQQIAWWIEEMKVQGMLRTNIDPAKLILK